MARFSRIAFILLSSTLRVDSIISRWGNSTEFSFFFNPNRNGGHPKKPQGPVIPNTIVAMPDDYEDYRRGHSEYNLFDNPVPGFRVPMPPLGIGIPAFDPNHPKQFPEVFIDASPQDPVGHYCAPGGDAAGHYFYNIWKPTLVSYVLHPNAENRTDAAVVIAPGGGSIHLAWEPEGIATAEWFNSMGVSAFILKYRVPTGGNDDIQLMDAQRALSYVRSNAAKFKIDPAKIGFAGFSAGGDLGIRLAFAADRLYNPVDEVDAVPYRPDFVFLMYPGIPKNLPDEGFKNLPPVLLGFTQDDPCCPRSITREFVTRMAQHSKQPSLVHEFPNGKHGWGDCRYYPHLGGKAVCHWKKDYGRPFLRKYVLKDNHSAESRSVNTSIS